MLRVNRDMHTHASCNVSMQDKLSFPIRMVFPIVIAHYEVQQRVLAVHYPDLRALVANCRPYEMARSDFQKGSDRPLSSLVG